jgi:hypothetical protein
VVASTCRAAGSRVGAERLFVLGVGEEPQRAAQRLRIVVERRLRRRIPRVGVAEIELQLAIRRRVVELIVADAHLGPRLPVVARALVDGRAEAAADAARLIIAHRVGDEVGRLVALQAQARHRARQLGRHRRQHR